MSDNWTISELEDGIKKNETKIKNNTRKLGAERITVALLTEHDVSDLTKYDEIRQEVLDTYSDEKMPEFKVDLLEKARDRVTGVLNTIDRLEKLNILYKEKILKINGSNLDDFPKKESKDTQQLN